VVAHIDACRRRSTSLAPENNVDYRYGMGVLQSSVPAIVICTRDREKSTSFYRDALGLVLTHEDRFAAVFSIAGVTLRVSHVPGFLPHEHTILGFTVQDVGSTVAALAERGVAFNRYPAFTQDERGILTLPGGKQVAWFQDPDGNVLSVTDVT
jgi:catechol 2,3-dioxygenase-like lactoylglutathione lyase family enzyme